LGGRAAHGRHLGPIVAPVLRFGIQANRHGAPASRWKACGARFLSPKPDGVDTVRIHALAVVGTTGLQAADWAGQSQCALIGRGVARVGLWGGGWGGCVGGRLWGGVWARIMPSGARTM